MKSSFSFFRRHESSWTTGEEVEDELNSEGESGDEDDEDDVHDIDHTKLPKEEVCTHSPTSRTRKSEVWSHLKRIYLYICASGQWMNKL